MESVSRPPHRRKHSTTTNASSSSSSFSLKNPYDDVLLSKGGKAKFEAHEYAEIFSGSSSIPVLDLSGLNEQVGSGDCRSSKLDYSNIFGGLRDDDVAVPYEQLFNGALKKNKTRIPADAESPFQEPGSLNSSGKTNRSLGTSDQSIDGTKQHFNMSFNKTSQRNSDESNGKTHIAQLHAVPGFTHFVDETPHLQKKERDRPVPLMKREVSCTWSFNSGVEGITVKGGLSSEKSHIPDKSCNGNEINIKSHISKVPPPTSHPSSPNDNKDLRQSTLPSFASKDASKKTVGEYSPPLFDEELDENSVAAVSAAALKKAIEQAQESIRIAKMIMEKKKDGLKDGSRPRSNGRLKVKDKKETRIDHVPDDSKENNVRETYERLDPTFPMFTGVDGKFIPPLSHSDNFLNAGKAKVEVVRENVEAADEHGDAFTEVGKKFAPSCSRSEILNPDEKVGVESVRQNVEAAETCGETTSFTGLVANSTCGSVTLESGKGGNNDNIICSSNKVAPRLEQIETVKETLEQRELTIHQSKGPEVISERAESAPNTSQSVQELEKSVDEALEQCQATVDHIKGPENIAEQLERVLNCSESTQEQEKIMHERGGNLRISQEDEPIEESDNVADGKEKYEKRFVRHEELVCLEHLTVLKSEFNNLQNESRSLAEKDVMEQADMDKKSENVSEWKENDQDGKSSDEEENGMVLKKKHLWFESELQPMEPMEEEISEGEPEIFPEVEVGTKVNVAYEPEIVDKKLNFEHEEDGQKLPREYGQNEIAYRHMDSFECEAAETIQLETNNYSEVQKSGVPWGVEEINDTLRGSGRSKENQDKFEFQEAASGKDIDEAVDAHCNNSGTIFSDSHSNSTSTIFSETQEPCDVDLNNKAEEYQAAVSGVPRDVEEINDTHRGAGRSEENRDKFEFQEVASGKDIDEAVDAHCNDSGTIFSDSHSNNTSTICSETQEPCDIDLNNKAEEYQAAVRGCKQNDSLPLETETFSAVEDEVGKPFHLEVNKMPGTDSLRRCASEEKFIESQPNNTFEEFSFDRKTYNVDLMDADNEETLSTDEDTFKTDSEIHNAAQEYAAKINMQNLPEFHATNNNATEFGNTNVKPVLEQTSESNEESLLTSILENRDEVSAHESQACRENVKDNASNKEEVKDDLDMTSDEREYVGGEQSECLYSKDQSREVSSQTNCEPKEMDKSMEAEREVETGQNMEMNEENLSRTSTMGQKDAKGNEQQFATNDHQQRIEAIKRGREREKDRIVVERAIREARERAFAEARDRAERAAVERAAAEARQRVMAEVREKHEKASIETKQPAADKASNEAKLRAERAAVERATAEARERALEKAMSQKTFIEARTQAEKYSTDRFSSSSRNNGLKHSFSSSDLEKFDGATSESAQRRKARLERHQRIMERAAKALAEKNMRDLLAQKEQAERNRLAESLDADIKRWATGKEGNLRALLSTLQYILGPDSGWQPISLTEIITTAAVKKAYRKATLCVHPDKLQQRGASIQQKYICEKVFDLLKAAWNRFNSEER